MAYASVEDMVELFGEAEMIRLSSLGDMTQIDVSRVQTSLERASDFIDSHLRRRYACPLPVTPPAINRACIMLARYDLSFTGSTEPSEPVRLARKETVEWLGQLNSGSVSLEGVELASAVVYARTQDRRRFPSGGDWPFRAPGSGLDCYAGGFGLW